MAKKIKQFPTPQFEGKSKSEIFELLYNRYVDDLYAFGVHMGMNQALVKDAIHDVFLAMFARDGDLAYIGDIKSYLFRALNNRIIDLWRCHTPSVGVEALNSVCVDRSNIDKIEDADVAQNVANHLNLIMQKLTYNQRSAVYLRFICEMKYSDIAVILNCTEHAARKFVSKALANMRKYQNKLGQ